MLYFPIKKVTLLTGVHNMQDRVEEYMMERERERERERENGLHYVELCERGQ